MTILEEIRANNRVARMRMGQNVPDYVQLRSNPEIRMAVVPLLEKEAQAAWAAAASADIPDNAYGVEVRDKILVSHRLFYALREPDNLDKKVFESAEQLMAELQDQDVEHLAEAWQAVTEYASPALEGFSDEMLDDLKKVFETIDLSGLSGRAWWLLKAFFMTTSVEQLRAKSHLLSSIQNSIGTNDEIESIPGV